jgi:hypothetical protein
MSFDYKFQFAEDNVYGHTVRLVREFGASSGVHLDVGCGFGAIAEPLRDLGLTYVGIDVDGDGLEDLRKRGFETHEVDLLRADDLQARVRAVLGGRPLASISVLDTLEHVTDDLDVLAALRSLAGGASVPLVVSVPNVAHRDLALKLLTGRWDYTETGLLDRTHVVHHTERLLEAMTRTTGWREVGRMDILLDESDQHFPKDSVVLSATSSLNAFLRNVRDACDTNARTVQLVRAYLPGPTHPTSTLVERDLQERPFLSVIVRTQGRRPATLRDALLSLTAQTCQDFEILVVGHKIDTAQQIAIERQIEELPAGIRSRAQLVRVDSGGRATPLNRGFAEARGRYIAVLDDDDVVFGHWVETFKQAASTASGRVLRTVAVEQQIEARDWSDGRAGFRTVDGTRKVYPSEYDLFAHFTQNHTPLMCLAFPASLFHELGFRFDERLNTCEDWEFEMRAVLLCGVTAIPEITAIYRRWKNGHSSYSLHSKDEWRANEELIVDKLDSTPHVFPPGTIRRIREQQAQIRALRDGSPAARWTPPETLVAGQPLPLRYKLVDRLNSAVKRVPGVHRLLKASLTPRR